MDLQNIILFIIGSLDLILGLLIISRGVKKEINISYSLFVLWVALWTIGIAMFRYVDDYDSLLFWNREFIITAALIASSLLHFSFIFPYSTIKITNLKRILIYIPNIIILLAAISPGIMIKDIAVRPWGHESILGCGYIYYGIYFSVLSIWAFVNLWRKHKKSKGIVKTQIFYVLTGLLISLVFGAIFNLFFILFGNYKFIWLGPYASFIMIAFIGYAIVVHRLMDIKFVLRRSSVFLASLSTILLLAISAQYVSIKFFTDSATWINVLILIAAISIFPPIKNYYYRLASKYFFTSLYDGRTVIADLSDQLRSTLKAGKIYKYISATFINSFHAKAVGILTYDKKTRNYLVEYNKGFHFSRQWEIHLFSNFRNAFIKQNKPVVVEEIKHTAYKKYKKTIDRLTKRGIEILTPLNVKNKTIGLIVLGAKESGDMYNNEDLSVLKIIGAQAAIAIENALLYEETKNFTVKLKKEVKKATEDVKKANKQLRKLDAAKSNFISIASHQLRTPLTVIKGYISMMIEGSFGKLTKEELESLKKVYESNERLIQLVEDLLNISRIESGKLQFDFQETRLEEVVSSVAEELAGSAKQKGLALEYKKLGQPLPMVKIDGEKIRYVVLNLIDNAIKYTKQGSITVNLRLGKKHIYFCVVDTGIGIGEEDLSNLFKKFSRGKDISIVHTEGAGMGLYVGKMMVKAHRGKIWVESEGKNKGSKFCFKLPID